MSQALIELDGCWQEMQHYVQGQSRDPSTSSGTVATLDMLLMAFHGPNDGTLKVCRAQGETVVGLSKFPGMSREWPAEGVNLTVTGSSPSVYLSSRARIVNHDGNNVRLCSLVKSSRAELKFAALWSL